MVKEVVIKPPQMIVIYFIMLYLTGSHQFVMFLSTNPSIIAS